MAGFENFYKRFAEDTGAFKKIYDSLTPQTEKIP